MLWKSGSLGGNYPNFHPPMRPHPPSMLGEQDAGTSSGAHEHPTSWQTPVCPDKSPDRCTGRKAALGARHKEELCCLPSYATALLKQQLIEDILKMLLIQNKTSFQPWAEFDDVV